MTKKYQLKSEPRKSLLQRHKATLLGLLVAVLLVGGLLVSLSSTNRSDNTTQSEESTVMTPEPEAQTNRSLLEDLTFAPNSPAAELAEFTFWLDDAGAKGFIGEAGWPATVSRTQEAVDWLEVLNRVGMPYTAWAAGSAWPEDYPLQFFIDSDDTLGLDVSQRQGTLLKSVPTELRGINIAGLEFGANNDAFSAANPGVLGTDYFNEPPETFAFLKEQGISLVRMPFSWERLQPQLGGELNQAYLTEITAFLDAAAANDIRVIVDLHNYGRYTTTSGNVLRIGEGISADNLTDVWQKIIAALDSYTSNGNGTIHSIGIMNEPHTLPSTAALTAARLWEQTSQQVLTDLRDSGYTGTILIPGYEWNKVQKWAENHPSGWIRDPLKNFMYEAHHYWDDDETGTYRGEI